ncbi:GntR family transcriptional regulator [Roseicella sp. DB1501]|uniref:GntR family transcriptional regulator n=1 Tax=Roseicella sp. DB1501 TaxID=2730925 RepID=UPI00149129D4|nr:GntR family transcriptional regulator [Roseicella sp. DB1501]NOG69022.1 GntR family transcriptional regulator [Roseicella sp. DB1501]
MDAETLPISGERVAIRVHHWLRQQLMRSRFRPGEKLKLRTLAEELGVSPTPVREALARLVSEGALEQVDHRSARVPVLSDVRLREVCELRCDLEGKAAERAAERAGPADAEALAAIHARMTQARVEGRMAEMLVENERFHMQLCALARMPVLLRMVEGLWLQCGPLNAGLQHMRFLHRPEDHPHHEVIRGIRQRDGGLARLAAQRDITLYADALLRRLPEINATQER